MTDKLFFKNLDTLRFLAFLGVFFLHTLPVSNHGTISGFVISTFTFIYLGVPFFFTLSGFLITYRLFEEHNNFNDIQLHKFYIKRGLRIWPIYFLLIFICYIILPVLFSFLHIEKPTLPKIFPLIFFWFNFYVIDHGINFIGALLVLWSISIEEQFYIFWGLMIKYCRQYIGIALPILLAVSIIFSYYYLYTLHQTTIDLKIHSLYALPNFCLGAFLAIACHSKNNIFITLKRLPKSFYPAVYLSLITFFIFQNLGITHIDIVITGVFNSACYALILFDQTFNDKRLFNAGKFKLINYLGRISYGLYIYHLLIASCMMKVFKFFNPNQKLYTITLQALITLLVTIFAAHISFRYFESYFLKLKDRL